MDRIRRSAIALAGLLAFSARAAYADGPPPGPVDYVPPAAAAPPVTIAAADPPPAEVGPSRKTVAFVAAGVAVVGIGIGAAFGVLALNTKSSFDANPTVAGANTGNQEALLADVAFGTAVIAGVTSVVLFLKHDDPAAAAAPGAAGKRASSASFSVAPLVTSHGGGAGVLVRF